MTPAANCFFLLSPLRVHLWLFLFIIHRVIFFRVFFSKFFTHAGKWAHKRLLLHDERRVSFRVVLDAIKSNDERVPFKWLSLSLKTSDGRQVLPVAHYRLGQGKDAKIKCNLCSRSLIFLLFYRQLSIRPRFLQRAEKHWPARKLIVAERKLFFIPRELMV